MASSLSSAARYSAKCSDCRRTGCSQSMPSQARSSIDRRLELRAGSAPRRCPPCAAETGRPPRAPCRSSTAPTAHGRDADGRSGSARSGKRVAAWLANMLASGAALRQNLEHDAHHSHPGRSGNGGRRRSSSRIRSWEPVFAKIRHAGDPPPGGRLCRAVLHRLRPAGFDRQRGGDPGAAVRGVRSIPPRYRAAGARRISSRGLACRGRRSSRSRRSARPSPKGHIDLDAVAAMEADQAHAALTALHGIGPVDRRHLSAVLPRQCRRLAGRRPRLAGGGAHRLRPEEAARRQGDGETRRRMAAVARGGRASVVGLLSRGEAARGRAGASDDGPP